LVRVTLTGPDLEGLTVEEPAASVRLLLPASDTERLVMPRWNGNEFLLPDGRRPTIRTFTPRRLDREVLELDIEAVIHGDGVASDLVGLLVRPAAGRASRRRARRRGPSCRARPGRARMGRRRSGRYATHPSPPVRGTIVVPRPHHGARLLETRARRRRREI